MSKNKSKPLPTLTAEELERFGARIDYADGPDSCWEWQGGRKATGHAYGVCRVGGGNKLTHRIAYTLAYGPIPEGHFVCHRCDNPPCCNPAHLFAGTAADNNADMRAKQRSWQPVGESSHLAKVREATILEIRARTDAGEKGTDLAREYGLSKAQVSYIKHGKTWKHLLASTPTPVRKRAA